MTTRTAFTFVASLATLALAQEPVPQPAPKPQAPARAPAGQEPQHLALGARMQREIVLKDIDGKEHRLGGGTDKVTVVNFYSIQCPIQASWDPALAAIQRDYEKKGVVFLGIDSNVTEIGKEPPQAGGDTRPYDNVRSHLKAKALPYTVLVDHGNVVADFFDARTTPHVFVFGKDGRLVYRGLIDDDQRGTKGERAKRYLKDMLDKLLAGAEVEPSETTSQGCSIKRVDTRGAGQRGQGRRDGGGN